MRLKVFRVSSLVLYSISFLCSVALFVFSIIYNDSEFYFTDGVSDRKFIESEELKKVAEKENSYGIYNTGSLVDTIEKVSKKYKDSNKVIFIIGSFYIYKEVVDILNKLKNNKVRV